MTDWRPNFDWINDSLAVGGSFPPARVESLARDHGVQAVIDLRDEDRDDEHLLRHHGITLLHLPTQDMCGVDAGHLEEGVRFANERLDLGERLLVHCTHGIGRSAVLALCVLVSRGQPPLEALGLMKDRRALVSPSPDQYECWAQWLGRHRRSHSVAWQVPDFDAFKAIAYRHLMGSS